MKSAGRRVFRKHFGRSQRPSGGKCFCVLCGCFQVFLGCFRNTGVSVSRPYRGKHHLLALDGGASVSRERSLAEWQERRGDCKR